MKQSETEVETALELAFDEHHELSGDLNYSYLGGNAGMAARTVLASGPGLTMFAISQGQRLLPGEVAACHGRGGRGKSLRFSGEGIAASGINMCSPGPGSTMKQGAGAQRWKKGGMDVNVAQRGKQCER